MTGWTHEHDQPNWADELVAQHGGAVGGKTPRQETKSAYHARRRADPERIAHKRKLDRERMRRKRASQ